MRTPSVKGSCFGFGVRTPLDLAYLREGPGEPLEVSVALPGAWRPSGRPLLEWTPSALHPHFRAQLYRTGARFRLWIAGEGGGWFHIDPRVPEIAVPESESSIRTEERLWGLPALLCMLHRDDLPVHAAAVEVEGEAVLLAAPAHFGKSTLAAGFARAGFRVLSEDLACVRFTRSGETTVLPGPAVLRLRPDVARRLALPHTRLLLEREDRVHLAFDPERRGTSAPVPLRAIVLLQAGLGASALVPLRPHEALRSFWALTFRLPTAADGARCFRQLARLAGSVPVCAFRYALGLDRLDEAVGAVAGAVGKPSQMDSCRRVGASASS